MPVAREARPFRVFISSPGDVADERAAARRVVESVLPQRPALRGRVHFEVVAWDHPEGGVAMPAGLTLHSALGYRTPAEARASMEGIIMRAAA